MTHNSLVVCQSNEFSRSRINNILLLYICFKLYTDYLNFSRGLIFAKKLIFEGLVLFVYVLRKHNFTAWVSYSHKHALDNIFQIFLRAMMRYIRCVVLFPNFVLRPKFILQRCEVSKTSIRPPDHAKA